MKLADIPFAISPGQYVLDELEARGLEYDAFAEALGDDSVDSAALLDGELEIGPDTAQKIADFFGMPQSIWLRLEENYRAALRAGKQVLNARVATAEESKPVSGKLLLRLPISLHARVAAVAKAEGVSLNQLLLSYVAEGIARTEAERATEAA